MTATLTAPAARTATTHALVVLVAPANSVHECDAALERTALAGALTITCEVAADDARFMEDVCTVLGAVDDAFSRYPGLPVVLVGHGAAAAVTSMAAETCGDDLAGLVLTHQQAAPGPVRHAA